MVLLWIIGAVVLVLIVVFVSYYNRIIQLENRIDNSWAQIDVQLKKRSDLVPNLVKTVKGYAKHEKGIMDAVSKARKEMMGAGTVEEKVAAGNMLTGALKSIFALAEAYPDLKANTNFLSLQEELSSIENKIAYARQHFNDSVLNFNNTVETFPGNLFAGMMGKSERKMLEIETAEKELPKVEF